MMIFFYEFLHFLSASLAVLVCISSAVLFIVTYRYERLLQTRWRAAGFLTLAAAFLLFILERKQPSIEILAVLVEAIAIFSIYKGVLSEPKLVHLRKVGPVPKEISLQKARSEAKSNVKLSRTFQVFLLLILLLFLFSILVYPGYNIMIGFLPSFIELIIVIFVIATIFIQYRRYQNEKQIKEARLQNLYPLLGYIFLLVRGIAMIFYRLPDVNVVTMRYLTLEYSFVWIIAVLATYGAFLCLAIWAWNFVKVRVFLRTYVVFIAIVILVSTLGSLIFTFFIFQIIEQNNLDLMLKGAETESIIMTDRSNTAMFIARLIAEDNKFLGDVSTNNYQSLKEITEKYLESSEADIIRVYNVFGEIIVSPSDPRDEGKVMADDSLVAFALMERKQVRTFDTYPGVLADYVITRAVHPLIINNTVIGVVEVGYKFDNAFVDFSKEKSNLDVTMYTGSKISATTIQTQDNVSRFVGTEESRNDITAAVLQEGNTFTTIEDRLGEKYYSAFSPVRNVNGEIIGMVSVGTPTFFLTEETRQRLLTTFIVVSVLSAIISLIGYYAMPHLRLTLKEQKEIKE